MDAKGRVFLPASFRRLLRDDEAEFVLKRDAFQPCLTVYPRAAWDAEVADLRSRLDPWRADHRMTLRRYVADVEVFSSYGPARATNSPSWATWPPIWKI